MDKLAAALGKSPDPVTGEKGSGVLLYLDHWNNEREGEKLLRAAEVKSTEAWRRRWTTIGAGVALVGGAIAIEDRTHILRRLIKFFAG